MISKIWIAAIAAVVFGIGVAGCTSNTQAGPSAQSQTGEPPAYTNAQGKLLCPVTGNVIASPKDAAGHQDYKGKRYYFCCPMCPPKFKEDPDKFVVRHETIPM